MSDNYWEKADIEIEYVDGITIVDSKGRIVYSVRYNPRFDESCKEREFNKLINRSVLEIYPGVNPEESTLINCLEKGIPIYNKSQIFHDFQGRPLHTQNLTIPIIKMGKVLGAIELSKDVTRIQDLSDSSTKEKENKRNNLENGLKKKDLVVKYNFDDIITKNAEMLDNIEKAKLISESPSAVLVYGETGTGKELFVHSIHNHSPRKDKPFIAQNCAALPENLFESLLFGAVKGAYTGAEDKAGLFELADGGTLFLDEINAMSLNLQAKLLRVLQDGFIRRVGGTRDRKVDVRVITAMNVNPVDAIKKRQIREDLFYRLNVNSIKLTPLRSRKEDISMLVNHFIDKYNRQFNCFVQGVEKEVEALFLLYSWPGNVRELQHVVEAAMNIVRRGKIDIKHLPVYLNDAINHISADDIEFHIETGDVDAIRKLGEMMEVMEKKMIEEALKRSGGNVSKASKLIGMPRQTLQYKITKHGIKI
ncbi:MAG: sigma-54 interaction domain-containing protein [Caulobacteraceae bacterium]